MPTKFTNNKKLYWVAVVAISIIIIIQIFFTVTQFNALSQPKPGAEIVNTPTPQSAKPAITTDKIEYSPDEEMRVTIQNPSESAIKICSPSVCSRPGGFAMAIEKYETDAWAEGMTACPRVIQEVETPITEADLSCLSLPGKTTLELSTPLGSQTGRFRVAFYLSKDNSNPIYSDEFKVIAVGVTARTDKFSYGQEDGIGITITNNLNREIGVSSCPYLEDQIWLEKMGQSGQWLELPLPTHRAQADCSGATILPGQSLEYPPDEVLYEMIEAQSDPAGTYRFRTGYGIADPVPGSVYPEHTAYEIYSNEFNIERAGVFDPKHKFDCAIDEDCAIRRVRCWQCDSDLSCTTKTWADCNLTPPAGSKGCLPRAPDPAWPASCKCVSSKCVSDKCLGGDCPGSKVVLIAPDKAEYLPGERVMVSLINNSKQAVRIRDVGEITAAVADLEKKVGDRWQGVYIESDPEVFKSKKDLASGETQIYYWDQKLLSPEDQKTIAGTYRFKFGLIYLTKDMANPEIDFVYSVKSNEFTIAENRK